MLVQRRASWMLGIVDLILDEHKKNKKFDLEELLPDSCSPEEEDVEDLDEH